MLYDEYAKFPVSSAEYFQAVSILWRCTEWRICGARRALERARANEDRTGVAIFEERLQRLLTCQQEL